jgi:excisionase family DNA binding protein
MTQPELPTYTIAEAAALTGLHKNTIRMRVKLGQLSAERALGKYGEEYRISQRTLIEAGLLASPEPPSTPAGSPTPPLLDSGERPEMETVPVASPAVFSDLFQRHEHAMFRLGFLEAEITRHKALAEHAESLQAEAAERELEIRELRRDLERAQERVREIDELRNLVREMERDTERMREEVERHRAATARRWWPLRLGKRRLTG